MSTTKISETVSLELESPPHLDFFRTQLDYPWFSTSLLSTLFGFSHEDVDNIRSHERWREFSEEVPTFSGGTKIETFYDARSMDYRTRMELVSSIAGYAEESYGNLFTFAEKAIALGEIFNINGLVLTAALYRSWQLQYAVDASKYMDLSPRDAIVAVSEGFLMPYDILWNLCSYYANKDEGSFLSISRELRFLSSISYCASQAGHLFPETDFCGDRVGNDSVCLLPSRSFSARELKGLLKLSLREIEHKARKHRWVLEWSPNEQGEWEWRFLSMDASTRSVIMQQLAFGETATAAPALVQ